MFAGGHPMFVCPLNVSLFLRSIIAQALHTRGEYHSRLFFKLTTLSPSFSYLSEYIKNVWDTCTHTHTGEQGKGRATSATRGERRQRPRCRPTRTTRGRLEEGTHETWNDARLMDTNKFVQNISLLSSVCSRIEIQFND